jgi:hypothetical protein
MQLVFARCEIYRRQILRGNLAIDSHGEGGGDEWAQMSLFHPNRGSAMAKTGR